jgi:hypothetical protein
MIMKKLIGSIAIVAAVGISASAASAEVGVYPGGLPGTTATIGPESWNFGRSRFAGGPMYNPAYRNAQEVAFTGALLPGGRGTGDRILRAEDEVLLRSDDRIIREIR